MLLLLFFFIYILRAGGLSSTPVESRQSVLRHTSSSPPLVSLDSGPLRQALGFQHYDQNCKECGLRGEADQTSQRYCDLCLVLLLAYHPSVKALNAVASCFAGGAQWICASLNENSAKPVAFGRQWRLPPQFLLYLMPLLQQRAHMLTQPQANPNLAKQLHQLLLRHDTTLHMVCRYNIISLSVPSTHTVGLAKP